MSWHILVMAQYGDLFSVMAGWNIGQRRLYGALLYNLRVDIVWRQCVGELRSRRRYTSRIGKARISGYVLKNADTIAICITSVKLGDGDGWHPGGGSRKPDITQVEPISEARLTQHGRLWRLAHVSGEEIAAPGPVNTTVILDAHNMPRTPRRLPERIQSQLSESRNAATSYLPELLISYRHPNNFNVAQAKSRPAQMCKEFTRKSVLSECDHLAIILLAHNSSGNVDTISLTGSTDRNWNTSLRDQEHIGPSLQSSVTHKNTANELSLLTYSTIITSAGSESTPILATRQASTEIKPGLSGQKFGRRELQQEGANYGIKNINWDYRSHLLQ